MVESKLLGLASFAMIALWGTCTAADISTSGPTVAEFSGIDTMPSADRGNGNAPLEAELTMSRDVIPNFSGPSMFKRDFAETFTKNIKGEFTVDEVIENFKGYMRSQDGSAVTASSEDKKEADVIATAFANNLRNYLNLHGVRGNDTMTTASTDFISTIHYITEWIVWIHSRPSLKPLLREIMGTSQIVDIPDSMVNKATSWVKSLKDLNSALVPEWADITKIFGKRDSVDASRAWNELRGINLDVSKESNPDIIRNAILKGLADSTSYRGRRGMEPVKDALLTELKQHLNSLDTPADGTASGEEAYAKTLSEISKWIVQARGQPALYDSLASRLGRQDVTYQVSSLLGRMLLWTEWARANPPHQSTPAASKAVTPASTEANAYNKRDIASIASETDKTLRDLYDNYMKNIMDFLKNRELIDKLIDAGKVEFEDAIDIVNDWIDWARKNPPSFSGPKPDKSKSDDVPKTFAPDIPLPDQLREEANSKTTKTPLVPGNEKNSQAQRHVVPFNN